jgi:WD40 repeat protein
MIVFPAHKKAVTALAFSPDSRRLATAGKDADVRIWDASYESPSFVCACPASWWSSLAFSADGRNLGCVRKGGARVWELSDRDAQIRLTSPRGWECAFSPRGEAFLVAEHGQPLRRWRTADWTELPAFGGGRDQDADGHHRASLGHVACHPDGTLVAAPYAVFIRPTPPHVTETVIYLWDAATGAGRGEIRRPLEDKHPAAYAFSPTGKHLAAVQGHGLRVWDVRAQAEVAYTRAGRRGHTALTFTPDGARVVTVSGDKAVRLWETATWGEAGGFTWDVGAIHCVAVSPDGMRMAAGGSTGSVVIWDAD